MPALFEIGAQFAIVVDLAVENDSDALVLVEGRLFTSDEVDDGEPSHAECGATCYEQSFRVRAAMDHAFTHSVQQLVSAFRRRRVRIESGPTGDTAHDV